uniref:Uncharacterized protein n=1 Tax=Sphaerodactylus townsendi TaxID=933632 RepID=A0ACB8G913_9SAUR
MQASKDRHSKARRTVDILQPRESIKAHRQVIPTKEPSPPPLSSGPVLVLGPEAPRDSKQAMPEKDNLLPPFVRLKRLDIPPEEESSPHQNRPKEVTRAE